MEAIDTRITKKPNAAAAICLHRIFSVPWVDLSLQGLRAGRPSWHRNAKFQWGRKNQRHGSTPLELGVGEEKGRGGLGEKAEWIFFAFHMLKAWWIQKPTNLANKCVTSSSAKSAELDLLHNPKYFKGRKNQNLGKLVKIMCLLTLQWDFQLSFSQFW